MNKNISLNMNSFKALIGIGAFLLFIVYLNSNYVLALLGININSLSFDARIIVAVILGLLFSALLVYIYRKTLKKDFADFIKNIKSYKKYIEFWAVAYVLMVASSFIITYFFPTAVANNQETINDLFRLAPVYIIISSVFFAPFIEEMIFRLSFRHMFNGNIFFITMSGLTFGAMHVFSSLQSFYDLLYIIPYSIPGFFFAYTLVKSKNIFVPIGLHFIHNAFMVLLQVVLVSLV